MRPLRTRRQLLLGTASALAACAGSRLPASSRPPAEAPPTLAEVEARVGGRVGLAALDTTTGRLLLHRPDERFAMCSTFKWVLAAAILARVDRGQLALDTAVPFAASDLLEYAPVARAQLAAGAMSVEALCQAAVAVSDNTAANLLLARIGGPEGFTQYVRALDDVVTRLDRDEPSLNTNLPGDPRDTTTPRAMVALMRGVLCGDALAPTSRARLLAWMHASETGRERLRAGLPHDWSVGDKTGTGPRGAANDVAIATPPGRGPILIAAYLSDSDADLAALQAAHAELGRCVGRAFA